MSFFEFPHTRTYDSDLGFIIRWIRKNQPAIENLEEWRTSHELEYKILSDKVEGLIHNLVDVISPWDSSIAYRIFSIVEYQGTNYIAVQDVPVGVMITDTDYWQPANTTIEQINAMSVIVSALQRDQYYTTPEAFGAVGDGVADDTEAVKDAINSGIPVRAKGNYKLSSMITIPENADVAFYGTLINESSDMFFIQTTDATVYVNRTEGNGSNKCFIMYDPQNTSTAGATCRNNIQIDYIENFLAGFYLYSDTHNKGIQYNDFYSNRIINCTYAFYLETVGIRTWINENKFHVKAIAGTVSETIRYGFYAVSSRNAEITSNLIEYTVFEGCNEAVYMDYCHGNIFRNIRMAENNSGTYWVNMTDCYANDFSGYLNFNIKMIRDARTYPLTLNECRYTMNKFTFFNMQYRTTTWGGNVSIYTYGNERAIISPRGRTNYQFINIGDADFDMTHYNDNNDNSYVLSDGMTIIQKGNNNLTMPWIFGHAFNMFILYITDGNPVTVMLADGTGSKAITGYGKHIVEFTSDGIVSVAVS